MTFDIEGKYNTATVHTDEDPESVEESAYDQIEAMVNHPGFEGDGDIEIMPDFHYGAGAVIGFTMPLKNRVSPNTVGLDIGCGVLAHNFGSVSGISEDELAALDEAIRDRVPTGRSIHQSNDYHFGEDFPWALCHNYFQTFQSNTDIIDGCDRPDYSVEYFKELTDRVGYDIGRAINSMGTLGGGNHFIEIGTDADNPVYDGPQYDGTGGDLWAVIHSGSRGIGAAIGEYWTEQAHISTHADRIRSELESMETAKTYIKFDLETVSDKELLNWVTGGMGEDFVDYNALRDDFADTPERIGEISDQLKTVLDYTEDSPLDTLDGADAYGYIRDMIFGLVYAKESRKEMMNSVHEAIEDVLGDRPIIAAPESVHNYINPTDGMIRKGACSARDTELVLIPYNMRDGTMVCKGLSNDDWNLSAPHGAGRRMSRTEATNRFSDDDVEEQVSGTYASTTPIDEAPESYKDPAKISVEDTASVMGHIDPLLTIKGD